MATKTIMENMDDEKLSATSSVTAEVKKTASRRVAQFAQQCYEVVWQNVEVSFVMCLPIATRVLKAVMYYMMMYSLSYLLIVTHTVYCVDPLRNMGWIQGMFMSSSPLCTSLDAWKFWFLCKIRDALFGPLIAVGFASMEDIFGVIRRQPQQKNK